MAELTLPNVIDLVNKINEMDIDKKTANNAVDVISEIVKTFQPISEALQHIDAVAKAKKSINEGIDVVATIIKATSAIGPVNTNITWSDITTEINNIISAAQALDIPEDTSALTSIKSIQSKINPFLVGVATIATTINDYALGRLKDGKGDALDSAIVDTFDVAKFRENFIAIDLIIGEIIDSAKTFESANNGGKLAETITAANSTVKQYVKFITAYASLANIIREFGAKNATTLDPKAVETQFKNISYAVKIIAQQADELKDAKFDLPRVKEFESFINVMKDIIGGLTSLATMATKAMTVRILAPAIGYVARTVAIVIREMNQIFDTLNELDVSEDDLKALVFAFCLMDNIASLILVSAIKLPFVLALAPMYERYVETSVGIIKGTAQTLSNIDKVDVHNVKNAVKAVQLIDELCESMITINAHAIMAIVASIGLISNVKYLIGKIEEVFVLLGTLKPDVKNAENVHKTVYTIINTFALTTDLAKKAAKANITLRVLDKALAHMSDTVRSVALWLDIIAADLNRGFEAWDPLATKAEKFTKKAAKANITLRVLDKALPHTSDTVRSVTLWLDIIAVDFNRGFEAWDPLTTKAEKFTKTATQIEISMKKANIIFHVMCQVVTEMVKFALKYKMLAKVNIGEAITKFVDTINILSSQMDKLKDTDKAAKKMKNVELLIKSIATICVALILLTPLLYMFVLASPLIILGLLGFKLVMSVINKLLQFITGPRTVLTILRMIVIMDLLVLLMVALYYFGIIAIATLKLTPYILLGLGLLIVVIAAIALIGFAMTYVLPFIAAFVLSVALIVLAFAAIFLIVGLLWLVAQIELDEDAIMENVDKIFNVIGKIFERLTKRREHNGGERPSWLNQLAGLLGDTILMFVGFYMVLFAAVAVVGILLIAGMLRLLQMIELDEDAILRNVNNVFAIIDTILAAVCRPVSMFSGKDDKGWFAKMIERVAGDIAALWQVLASVVYIMVAAIAIGMVLLIVSMLKLISLIDVNTLDKAKENIVKVFEVVDALLAQIFRKPDDATEGSESHSSIISWFLPLADIAKLLVTIIYVGLAFMAMAIVAGLVGELKLISLIDKETLEKAKENVGLVFDCTDAILTRIFEPRQSEANGGAPWWKKVLNLIGLGDIVEALMAIATVGILFVLISLIASLAEKLEFIGNLDIEIVKTAPNKVKDIIDAAENIRTQIFNMPKAPAPSDDAPWWKAPFMKIGEMMDEYEALRRFESLGETMGMLGTILSPLQAIKEFEEEPFDTESVKKKVNNIFSALSTIMDVIIHRGDSTLEDKADKAQDALDEFDSDMRDALDMLYKISEPLKRLQDLKIDAKKAKSQVSAIFDINNYIADLAMTWKSTAITRAHMIKFTHTIYTLSETIRAIQSGVIGQDISSAKDSTNEVLDVLKVISDARFNNDNFDKNIKRIDELNKRLRSIVRVTGADVRNSKELTDNYIKFINRLDKADFQKLKTTEQMMRWWAELSKSINGNFDSMAEAINEHIMPMLKALDETMKGVSEVQQEIIGYLSTDSTGDTGSRSTGGGFSTGGGDPTQTTDGGGYTGGAIGGGGAATPQSSGVGDRTTESNPKPQVETVHKNVGHGAGQLGTSGNPFYVVRLDGPSGNILK